MGSTTVLALIREQDLESDTHAIVQQKKKLKGRKKEYYRREGKIFEKPHHTHFTL